MSESYCLFAVFLEGHAAAVEAKRPGMARLLRELEQQVKDARARR